MKFKSFSIVVGYVFSVAAGLGYSFFLKRYELVAAVVILGIIGFSAFKNAIKDLRSEK